MGTQWSLIKTLAAGELGASQRYKHREALGFSLPLGTLWIL